MAVDRSPAHFRRAPFLGLVFLLGSGPAHADGFVQTIVADSLNNPVSMAVAPDGRILVCEQGGRLRVIENGVLLPQPFHTVTTVANDEEGLLGVAFDPDFSDTGSVYVYYTALSPLRHNRVSRFVANGNVAMPTELILYDLDNTPVSVHHHQGGALRFLPDGTLLVAMGDNGNAGNAQSLVSTSGKILRIARNGSIPADNPFHGSTSGRHRAIWALGFRNPFTMDLDPGSGSLFVNDVGGLSFEEVNDVVRGGNYGWPHHEGVGGAPSYTDPIHSYPTFTGCAVTGAAFYDPPVVNFPAQYTGKYFYTEYCRNEIRYLDPAAPGSYSVLAPTLRAGPVDVRVAPDGSLYYLARGNSSANGGDGSITGVVVRVRYESSAGAPWSSGTSMRLRAIPNPFTERVTLAFTLAQPGRVALRVLDVRGRIVATVHEGDLRSGTHTVAWSFAPAAPGLYFASLTATGRNEVLRIAHVR